MKLHDQKVSDENVNRYNDQLALAALFPPLKARRYGNSAEVINGAGADLLASIHGEIGDWDENEAAALREWNDEQDRLKDLGLVTEENNKRSIDDIGETMERIAQLLSRHHGFKDGFHRTEDRTGYNRHLRLSAAGKADESDE